MVSWHSRQEKTNSQRRTRALSITIYVDIDKSPDNKDGVQRSFLLLRLTVKFNLFRKRLLAVKNVVFPLSQV